MIRPLFVALAVAHLLVAAASRGAPAADAAPSAPNGYRVKLVPFKIEARLEGTFESSEMTRIVVKPKRWTQLTVEEAVPHGTRVEKGDVLVKVETDKLDEAIRELELAQRLSDINHGLMQRELARLEKATPLQLEDARRAARIVAEDFKRYREKEAPLEAEAVDVSLKASNFSLENALEELEQLEKMYEQDELTEETEEIVLKRSRFQAEISRFMNKISANRHDRAVTLDLPRVKESEASAAQLAEIELERANDSLPTALARMKVEIDKSANDRRKSAEQLAELRADRGLLPVKAPAAGIVYYGRWQQGRWSGADDSALKLRSGGLLDPREVVVTIVGQGRLSVAAVVPEKDLGKVAAEAVAAVLPKAFPEMRIPARVRNVSAVPVSNGRFEAKIDLLEEKPQLVAGMEAEVRVTAVAKPEALAIPRKAVFTDELDDGQRYVWIVAGEGKEPVKRTVSVGRANDELAEITVGLSVGEEILLEKPSAKAAAKPAAKAEQKPADKPAEKPAEEPAEPKAG
jgi:HlyD family secretion protein